MNVALWVIQGILAAGYLLAGITKATQPVPTLAKTMMWVPSTPLPFVRFIGIAEVLGAIGLILPLVTGIAPWLTIAAAAGLVIVQIGAVGLHVSRGESSRLAVNVIFLLLALAIVVGRIAWVPIA